MGLEAITHAINDRTLVGDPKAPEKTVLIRALPETKQIQLEFPDGELSIEECGALLFQATRLIGIKIKAKQGITTADASVLAKLKRDRNATNRTDK